MRFFILILTLLTLSISVYGQDKAYLGRKGINLPGHIDIAITINNDTLRYELFNHWYTESYAELRQVLIPVKDLELYSSANDSLSFKVNEKYIHIVDKKYGINKKIKSRKDSTPIEIMRKISYAYKIAKENELMHFNLYISDDLKLNERDFQKKIEKNLDTNKEKTD